MSFTLKTLTEGIRDRHVGQQNKRLVEKWSRTGLLRGMDDVNRENMATLLENQAAQVLRESNTMAQGDVGGFTNIAFPIVRRVFGGLVANELVSIQPMSLPSGLLFYLDYTYGSDNGPYSQGDSIYGSPSGSAIQGGADAAGGQYDLVGSGFSRVHDVVEAAAAAGAAEAATATTNRTELRQDLVELLTIQEFNEATAAHRDLIDHDSQIIDLSAAGRVFYFLAVKTDKLTGFDKTAVKDISIRDLADTAALPGGALSELPGKAIQSGRAHNIRRLNKLGTVSNGVFTSDPLNGDRVLMLVPANSDANGDHTDTVPDAVANGDADLAQFTITFVKEDTVTFSDSGEATTASPAFESDMAAGTPSPVIPEIDIKIESIPVTAQTRKLRARWSPELAQDLNAYHSMDAEVELTQILSEQIALEIDREILGDLLSGAKGANFFWSRAPGKFVNKRTGAEIVKAAATNPGPAFTGTVREWYETLTETVIDVANEIHRKTLRGSANFIVVSPDVATILEASVLYRPSYSLDGDGQVGAPFTMGAEKVGTLSNRFTVYKDPYFPRNKILVGYKGGSYLETGFVYAPYVPLIVTPTIFQPEDFTPRKGVMTRYGKKMVRADFYGTVTCLDMNII